MSRHAGPGHGWGRPALPSTSSPPSPTLGFARAGGAPTDRHVYAPHAHDEFTVGVTVGGLEVIAYRGGHIHSGPGSIVVLEPGEVHTGGPAAPDGYSYRALYASPSLLTDGTRTAALPHFREPVIDDPELAAALRAAHTDLARCPDPPPVP